VQQIHREMNLIQPGLTKGENIELFKKP